MATNDEFHFRGNFFWYMIIVVETPCWRLNLADKNKFGMLLFYAPGLRRQHGVSTKIIRGYSCIRGYQPTKTSPLYSV
jgi:hypothetical protein